MLSKSSMKIQYFYLIIIILCITSCRKPEEFPIEPVITYKDIYTIRDTSEFDEKIKVIINFTDGDGDVGYRVNGQNDSIFDDPNSQYYNNYIAKLFQFKSGNWVEYPTILPLGGRLPYLTPVGKNKALKGEITCDIDVPPQSANDTFRFDIFIYDRSLHQSNTVTTSAIILKTH